ncbi:MAG: hypothetical protein OEW75_05330 [Cyclobacteriaceae bacterium]|nr:hypothetical protein [Cyclobacteriaceae bacterium]
MKNQLTNEEVDSVKQSFFNILSLLLGKHSVESKYVVCLLKWATQLGINSEDFRKIEENYRSISFEMPTSSEEKLEALFNLVQMIYLDNIIEDIELEVASVYAEQLGYEKYIIGELFQSIATAPFDDKSIDDVRKDIKEFFKTK